MNNHTPGPWSYELEDSQLIRDSEGNSIVEVFLPMHRELGYDKSAEIQEANARLIAAAPDLLEALKQLMADYEAIIAGEFNWNESDENSPLWVKCNQAIAKAGGA